METKDRGIFVLRAAVGLGLLFAGLDKFLMWSGGTPFSAAGYLQHATGGAWLGSAANQIVNPTHSFWVALGQNATLMPIVDTLVVFGECAVGTALILGLATRFSAVMGVILMAMLYISNWSFSTGPFNEQFMYLLVMAVVAYVGAGAYALDSVVSKLSITEAITQRIPVVKYALG